jgi:hypothetical protein
MVTRTWRVYGAEGHRQGESFSASFVYDFSNQWGRKGVCIIEVENADKTGTNDYAIVRITRETSEECEAELMGQITDGIFENYRTGAIVEI